MNNPIRNKSIFIVAITGGTGSGKSTLTDAVAKLADGKAAVIREDWYYKDLKHLPWDARSAWNFDHPDSYDHQNLALDLDKLKRGQDIQVPIYDFKTHTRQGYKAFAPAEIILVEGILITCDPGCLRQIDLGIYVDTPDDIRLLRRIERDIRERGRTVESVRDQYLATVRPMHLKFVEPSQTHADMIVDGCGELSENVRKVWDRIQVCVNDLSGEM